MHKNFLQWVNGNLELFTGWGLTVQTLDFESESQTNPSRAVDFVSKKRMGRITVWESGAAYLEVLDFESGDSIFDEHKDLGMQVDYTKAFERFFDEMRAN
ncbi:MAG: hypothetical protein ACM3UZ_06305 [Acidobacteriota bacterium]